MTAPLPMVDVNLLVYNAESTIAAAIESVLAQTWPARTLTVIDNASTDSTPQIVRDYARSDPCIQYRRLRANVGSVVNCQNAFSAGHADFVMPKTADDLIAPTFLEQTMAVLLAHPDCVMCHSAGLVFVADGAVKHVYPSTHLLQAIGNNARERSAHVMQHYTSAPSFWGVYRRSSVDRLARFAYRAGWDHVMLAELALYGEIRHVRPTLYWRRDGGKPVQEIARACTHAAQRGISLEDELAELRWTTPYITTAHAHVEAFAVARMSHADRALLMQDAIRIFRGRWLPLMQREAASFASTLGTRIAAATEAPQGIAKWMIQQIADATHAVDALLPEERVAAFFTSLLATSNLAIR
ncbi:MAG TPA: glycosyltransferase family A protein [Bradyrhizobium sp.]